MRRALLALLFFFTCTLVALLFSSPARPRTDSTRRENIIKRALERKHWPRSAHAVRLSLIVGKYIAEKRFGWRAGQWQALRALWAHESGWRWWARNPYSGACGIPQFHPCGKGGPGFTTSPVIQIRRGSFYIEDRYGSPLAACQGSCSSGTYRVAAA